MKKYFILAAAAISFAACSNDENNNTVAENNAETITLTASVGEAEQTRAANNIQSQAFLENELINVECTPSVTGTMTSVIYKTGAPDGENKNELTAQSAALTWPASGTVALKAFYPSTVKSADTDFTVQTTQDDAGYKNSDLMYATDAEGNAITAQAKVAKVPLKFNHALSKVIVNVTNGNGMTASDVAACTVEVYANTKVDIASGVADAATAATPAWITLGTGSGQAAIIVPQNITATAGAPANFIRVTTAGSHAVTYQLKADKSFAAGKVYTYNLKVGMGTITLESSQINNWDGAGNNIDETGNPLTF